MLATLTKTSATDARRYFRFGWKSSGRLFGIDETPRNRDFKHPTAGSLQRDLCGWMNFLNLCHRRTGDRFVTSLAAVFDFDDHRSTSVEITMDQFPVKWWQSVGPLASAAVLTRRNGPNNPAGTDRLTPETFCDRGAPAFGKAAQELNVAGVIE